MPNRPRVSRFTEAQRRASRDREQRQAESAGDSIEPDAIEELTGSGRAGRRADDAPEDKLRALEQLLGIEENGLEASCTVQPDALYRVAKELALQRSRRDAKKKLLEEKEAEIYVRLRHDASMADERITEAEIKARTTLDNGCKQLANDLLAENETLAKWEALREAFSQRSYMLRELVALYLARYYGGDPARSAENRMRDLATDRLADARRERYGAGR